MKSNTLRQIALLCFLSLFSGALAHAFEGKVVMKMTAGKDSMPMTYYVKGDKIRMEFAAAGGRGEAQGGSMATIADMTAHEIIMLMPEQKMYMVHRLPEMDPEKAGKNAPDVQFKPTGRKEKIAGYDAEEYTGLSEGRQTDVWVTKGLGQFMMANQGKGMGKAKRSEWEAFMKKGDFFPLRVVQRKKQNGPEEFRMEVTNIDKIPQNDSLFRPPADYQKFEMPNMGGMLKGLLPGGGQ